MSLENQELSVKDKVKRLNSMHVENYENNLLSRLKNKRGVSSINLNYRLNSQEDQILQRSSIIQDQEQIITDKEQQLLIAQQQLQITVLINENEELNQQLMSHAEAVAKDQLRVKKIINQLQSLVFRIQELDSVTVDPNQIKNIINITHDMNLNFSESEQYEIYSETQCQTQNNMTSRSCVEGDSQKPFFSANLYQNLLNEKTLTIKQQEQLIRQLLSDKQITRFNSNNGSLKEMPSNDVFVKNLHKLNPLQQSLVRIQMAQRILNEAPIEKTYFRQKK